MDGAPSCTFPTPYGYKLIEAPVETISGFTARLERIQNPSLFHDDVTFLRVDVSFETDHRVRIRVGLTRREPAVFQQSNVFNVF